MRLAPGSRFLRAASAALVFFALPLPVRTADAEGRPWTLDHSLAVRYVVRDYGWSSQWEAPEFPGDVASFSSSGDHFFFLTRHGDGGRDCTQYQLSIHATRQVRRDIEAGLALSSPLREVSVCADHAAFPGIGQVEWESDRTIVFKGKPAGEGQQIFRFDLESGALSSLTHKAYDTWRESRAGGSMAYIATTATRKDPWLDRYPVVSVARGELKELSTGGEVSVNAVLGSFKGGPERSFGSFVGYKSGYDFEGPWVSPDGRWAVAAFPSGTEAAPRQWVDYPGSRWFKQLPEFRLLDLERGGAASLLHAPVGMATVEDPLRPGASAAWSMSPVARWSADSRRVTLYNTALPLDGSDPARRTTAYNVSVDIATRAWSILSPVRSASDVPDEDGLRTLAPQPAKSALKVFLRQDANTPPMMVAADGPRETALLPPDPALEGVWRARAEPVDWVGADGRKETGGLMLPRDFAPGTPIPLVIQAYYWAPDHFLPDGPFPTAYAAQPLVARGFAVLALDIAHLAAPDPQGTPAEGPAFVERIDRAIEALARRGTIDPARVGLVGFSRGGYLTYYAVTHPGRYRLAAAVDADGWSGSFAEYLLDSATSVNTSSARFYEAQYGGPFWKQPSAWFDQAPSFAVDRVTTPILFTTFGREGALFAAETVGAFRLNRKPFEFLVFPHGSHQLTRPGERRASLQATIDWMNFWLRGEAPGDAARAMRWAMMPEASEQ